MKSRLKHPVRNEPLCRSAPTEPTQRRSGRCRTGQWLGVISAWVLAAASVGGRLDAADVEVVYQPSQRKIANPERGFYVQRTARSAGKPLSRRDLERLRERGITLVLRMYYLKQFRNQRLTAAHLDLIQADFATVRQAGCKCIVRFAYSSRIGEPDAPLEVIRQHLDQLEPLLRDNADVIAVFQAGFIGAWGELHSSTNGLSNPRSICLLVDRLLKALPAGRSVQVRTPRQKQACVGAGQKLTPDTAFSTAAIARIGHHNDCFLADATDRGTYRESQIDIQKQQLNLETRYVPMGGETCRPSKFSTVAHARAELSQMHWTYLNSEYHPEIISAWRELGFLEEVEKQLGYRLSLTSSLCSPAVASRGELSISLRLQNTGWAAPINPRDVLVIAQHEESSVAYQVRLNTDPRYWLPDQPIEVTAAIGIPKTMSAGKYRLFLALPDPAPRLRARAEYAIKLANHGLWDPQTGRHDLQQTITVSSSSVQRQRNPGLWFTISP